MPRTILTDDVIERKCPEYQPLELPNAYFKNVGGMVRSQGIKATPIRAPPRPSRIQYLAQNSNMSLIELERQVSKDLENAVVQSTINQIVEQPNIMNFPLAIGSFEALEEKEELEEKQQPLLEEKEEEKRERPRFTIFQQIRNKQEQIDIIREKIREAADKGDMPLINKLEKEFQKAILIRDELRKQSPGGRFVEARGELEALKIPKTTRAISDERVAEAQARLSKAEEALRAREEKEFDKSARMKIMGAKMKPVLKVPGTQPAFTKAMEKEREATERLKMASRDPSLRGFMRGSMAEEE